MGFNFIIILQTNKQSKMVVDDAAKPYRKYYFSKKSRSFAPAHTRNA